MRDWTYCLAYTYSSLFFKELIFFMDPASSMQIAALIVLVLLSAFFSGTETAFTSFNKTRMKTLAGDGNKKAKAVMKVE